MSLIKNKKIWIMFASLICPTLISLVLTEFCLFFGIAISPSIIIDKVFSKAFIFLFVVLIFLILVGIISFVIEVHKKIRYSILITICLIIGNIAAFVIWDRFIQLYTDRYTSIIIQRTTWAPGFSDEKFKEIKENYSREDVIRIVGQPLRSFQSSVNEEVLVYSDIGHRRTIAEKGYHQRWLVLRDDKVIKIYRRYIRADANPLNNSNRKRKLNKWQLF